MTELNVTDLTVNKMYVKDPVTGHTITLEAIAGPKLQISQALGPRGTVDVYGIMDSMTITDQDTGGGAIMLGNGYTSASDPPQIILTDYGFPELYLKQNDGSYADIRLRYAVTESVVINPRSTDIPSAPDGQIWIRSN